MGRSKNQGVGREELLDVTCIFRGLSKQHKEVNCPHHKDLAEPGDIFLVVSECIVQVPIFERIEVISELTSNLQANQEEYRAENLSEKHEQFDNDPHSSLRLPGVIFCLCKVLLLKENGVHDGTHVHEQFNCVEHPESKPVLVVVFWCRKQKHDDCKENIDTVGKPELVDHLQCLIKLIFLLFLSLKLHLLRQGREPQKQDAGYK